MLQRTAILMLGMLMTLGCSLATSATRIATPAPTQIALSTSLAQLPMTPTRTATVTPAPTPTNTAIPIVNRPCTPRADWSIYAVIAGDTVADIAWRTGSTVMDLATANCLADTNNIFVDQHLRVPRIPAAATPRSNILSFHVASEIDPPHLEWFTLNAASAVLSVSGPRGAYIGYGVQPANGLFLLPDLGIDFAPYATFILTIKDYAGRDIIGPNGLPVSARVDVETGNAPLDCPPLTGMGDGVIQVSPVLGMAERCSTVRSYQTIWITWEGVTGLNSAEYYFMPFAGANCGIPGSANVIGVDQNIADGNMITWYVDAGPCAGILYAFGYAEGKLIESRQHGLVIYHN